MKTNPMQKFHQYKKMWNKQKVPGEKTHNDLRWSIREQMLEKHVFVKVNNIYNDSIYLYFLNKSKHNLNLTIEKC